MKNPFEIFQIKPVVSIDQETLMTIYRQLAKTHHPDQGGKAEAMEEINAAYHTLRDPLKRLHVLMVILGVEVENNDVCDDQYILQEVFELRACGDKTVIENVKQQAYIDFEKAYDRQDSAHMLQAYRRLLYLR